jgi:hypothetical protein
MFFNFNSICTSKLKLKPHQVHVQTPSMITVKPSSAKESLDGALRTLKDTLPNVVIKVTPYL